MMETMDFEVIKEMEAGLAEALGETARAVEKMLDERILPRAPLPSTPKQFKCYGYVWPSISVHGEVFWEVIEVPGEVMHSFRTGDYGNQAVSILNRLGYLPGRYFKFVQFLERIQRWCEHRLEGRLRHSKNLLEQEPHRSALEQLKQMAAVRQISEGSE